MIYQALLYAFLALALGAGVTNFFLKTNKHQNKLFIIMLIGVAGTAFFADLQNDLMKAKSDYQCEKAGGTSYIMTDGSNSRVCIGSHELIHTNTGAAE